MVTVEPAAILAGGAGLWLITWPIGADEVGSGLALTWKPAFCRVDIAAVSCWPTTLGTATGAAPVDTYNVTTVFAETLLPSAGLDLITRPLVTLELG